MNSILFLTTFEPSRKSPNEVCERYFRLDVDLPGVPLKGDEFHFMIESTDYDVVVCNIEWEVHADGKVKPSIQLTWPEALEENSPSYPENEPIHVEWLLRAGWKEVNSPYSEPR